MGRNILLVEDDVLLSEMYSFALKESGFKVKVAVDGKSALHQDLDKIDLILLDVRLPEVDGLTVLRFYRQNAFQKPIIIITNSPQINAKEAIKQGATDFLVKSHTDLDDLVELVKKYL